MAEPELKSPRSDDPHCYCYQARAALEESIRRLRTLLAEAKAEAAPLRAALKGRCCTIEIDGEGNATHEPNCPLSDAGKGWVSPEVGEQVRDDLEAGLHLMSARDDPTAYSYVKDALAALEGVE